MSYTYSIFEIFISFLCYGKGNSLGILMKNRMPLSSILKIKSDHKVQIIVTKVSA